MITSNLYNRVLVDPILNNKANKLFIVSGYASATFLRRHLLELIEKKILFSLNLIIGMPSSKSNHNAFLQIHNEFSDFFKGYYFNGSVPVHSKVYTWCNNDDIPVNGFSGSANYSQFGFFTDKQVNQMTEDNPIEIKAFFDSLLTNSVYIPDAVVEENILGRIPEISGSILPGDIEWIENDKSVRISFLSKKGNLPTRSGLNWGQRDGRDKDQAYLSLKKDSRKEGFLPEKGFTFTMLTDDDIVMDCVVAQDGRKGIHTTNDNSELGRYIRDRLKVSHGTFLTVDHLEEYGRTDFTLIKIDDETFLFDFSV